MSEMQLIFVITISCWKWAN